MHNTIKVPNNDNSCLLQHFQRCIYKPKVMLQLFNKQSYAYVSLATTSYPFSDEFYYQLAEQSLWSR